jgi:RNA polymerase sigma factor (sigma-70 family)
MYKDEESYTQRLSREIDAAHEAYKAGAPASDIGLYEAFLAQARNVVWQRLGRSDGSLEYDIAHRAFNALNSFREESRLSTWFMTIARNEINRALRTIVEDRRDRVPLKAESDPDPETPGVEPLAPPIDLDTPLDVETALQTLPPEQAEVLRLSLQGFTLEEIAEKTGAPLGTTRSRYTLAKARMARK